MSNRIDRRFETLAAAGRKALIPFLTAGYPEPDYTVPVLHALVEAGADVLELGVPFSDPTADGPVLQRSAARALARGVSLPRILEVVAEFRAESDVPVILFGYYNPFFRYGAERFCRDARQAGVNGLLVVDLPPEEADELWKPARAEGLDVIFLLAPTSDASRVKKVMRKASGFVYYVSMTGVTGSKAIDTGEVSTMVERLRADCPLPIGVGFGISSAADAAAVARFADAVVVGSAIMRLVEESGGDPSLPARVEAFVRELKAATHRGR